MCQVISAQQKTDRQNQSAIYRLQFLDLSSIDQSGVGVGLMNCDLVDDPDFGFEVVTVYQRGHGNCSAIGSASDLV